MDGQLITALAIVAAAALYVGRSLVRAVAGSRHKACGGCGSCAAPPAEDRPGMIPLNQVNDRSK